MDLIDILLEKFSKGLLKRNKGVGVTPNTSSTSKSDILKDFVKTRNSYKRELTKNLNALVSGKLNKDEYLAKQRDAIKNSYQNSFLLGKRFSQIDELSLSSDEIKSIGYQVGQEMTFMSKFADDVMNNGGRMNYSRRMQMYVDGLLPLFMFGRLAYLPEDIEIQWLLGDTDKHCIDCLSFASNSPYNKKNLPTIPKAGGSRCLSNCRCSLNYIGIPDSYDVSFVMENYRDNGGEPPDESAINTLKGMTASFYFYRGLATIDKDSDFMTNASNIKREYKEYIKDRGYSLKTDLPVGRFIKELSIFNKNNSFVRVIDTNVESGSIVSIHYSGKQLYGVVKRIQGNNLIIKNISGTEESYSLSNSIIFKMV